MLTLKTLFLSLLHVVQPFFQVHRGPNLPTSTEKNGFVTATKLGTTNKIFVAATKNFAAATKRFVDRTKHFIVVTKCFCYPNLTKDFVGITKRFFREL